jgi:ATP-dependent Lon protease
MVDKDTLRHMIARYYQQVGVRPSAREIYAMVRAANAVEAEQAKEDA